MSNILKRLLAEGDSLVQRHREQLPILATEWLKASGSPAVDDLLALMDPVSPSIYQDLTVLSSLPIGRLTYPIETERPVRWLGAITFYVNNPAKGVVGSIELRTTHTHHENLRLEEVTQEWLVISLKRADVITR